MKTLIHTKGGYYEKRHTVNGHRRGAYHLRGHRSPTNAANIKPMDKAAVAKEVGQETTKSKTTSTSTSGKTATIRSK